MKIIISSDVKNKITDIFYYSYNISSSYAHRIVKKIYEYIYILENYPYIGKYVPELSYKYYREKNCENYRIIYCTSKKENKIKFIFNIFFLEFKILICFLRSMKKLY